MTHLDRVVNAYIECAFWTADDETQKADLAPEALAQARRECAAFLLAADNLLEGIPAHQIGHDLWLTRNRHGVGFWDRDLGPTGDALTDLAHGARQRDLYVGDDGFAYFFPHPATNRAESGSEATV